MEKIGRIYWTISDAASRMGISPETLSKWIKRGYIKAEKRNDKSYNVPIKELVDYIILHYSHLPKKASAVRRAKEIKTSLF